MDNNSEKKITVGKDSVVIGNVTGDVGDNSVVIGAMDSNGNVILNQPMAIGKNAFASEGSIAIGANAGAGSQLPILLQQLRLTIEQTGDASFIEKLNIFESELKKEAPNRNLLKQTWETLKNIGSVNGMIGIAQKIESLLIYLA